jgi:hypothetical protein
MGLKMIRGMAVLGTVLFFFSCAENRSRKGDFPPEGNRILNESFPEPALFVDVVDYKGKSGRAALRPWVRAYLEYGNPGVEALSGYENVYAFVTEQRGEDTAVLSQWLGGFSLAQDFPRLVAARIRRRLVRGLARSADDEYGRNFERAVKAAYSTPFRGAWKEDDSWVLADEGNTGKPEYRYMILVLVPMNYLEGQINEMLFGLKTEGNTGEQNTAFYRVRDNFFEGF